MPLPEWAKRVPGRQSLLRRLATNLLSSDLVHPFGPTGTTTGAYGLAKPDAPLGEEPQTDGDGRNPLLHDGQPGPTPRATRPRRRR